MYRILHAEHHRTGNKWCIYPMYDFAHGQSDSIERITHSICTLEFEDHRPLYDWYVEQLGIYHPQQIEFDRLNLTYTLLSKRKLLQLVQQKHVSGWDDPRMPTISGLRRRGYTPEAIRNFCRRVGVSKTNGTTELALLEYFLREDLNKRAPRVMAVLRPLRVVIDNYPEGQVEQMEAVNNPEDASAGTRTVPFSRVLYIEQDDFREDPPKQYFRLSPGREVRLRYGYFITCTGVVKDDKGQVIEIHCTYDPATRGGNAPDGRKVKSTIHWVSAEHAIDAEVRLYDNLFTKEDPERSGRRPGFHRESESATRWKLSPAPSSNRACAAPGRQPLSVRAPGLFRRRSGYHGGQAGVQPHGRAARHLGENREEIEMIILGLGGILKDAACAVLKDGELLAAVEEEKVARQFRRGCAAGSGHRGRICRSRRLSAPDVNCVALARPFAQDIHLTLRSHFPNAQVVMVEHHAAHAASAYYPSPFEDATVLTLDRDGDFRSAARWRASGNQLQLEKDVYYPDSLGDLYGRVTELLGFNAGADEHKVQWLSTADSGDEFLRCCSRKSSAAAHGPASTARIFDSDRLSQGGFSEKFYSQAGLDDGAEIPQTKKAALGCRTAARRREHRAAHGRTRRKFVPRGRTGDQFAADQLARKIEASVRAARRRKRGHGARSRVLRLEQRLRPDQARVAQRSVPRPQL